MRRRFAKCENRRCNWTQSSMNVCNNWRRSRVDDRQRKVGCNQELNCGVERTTGKTVFNDSVEGQTSAN